MDNNDIIVRFNAYDFLYLLMEEVKKQCSDDDKVVELEECYRSKIQNGFFSQSAVSIRDIVWNDLVEGKNGWKTV